MYICLEGKIKKFCLKDSNLNLGLQVKDTTSKTDICIMCQKAQQTRY